MEEANDDYDIPYDMIYEDTTKIIPFRKTDEISNETAIHCMYELYNQTKYFYLFLFLVVASLIGILYVIIIIGS